MNELQKYNTPLTLTQKINVAKQSALLKDHDEESINDIVKVALLKAKQVTGYNTSEPDIIFFKEEIKKELLSHWKSLHLFEISIAFDLWSKQHYGEWIGFTVSNFLTYGLRPYVNDDKRIEALKPAEPKAGLTPEEIEAKNNEAGRIRFEELKKEFTEKGTCEDTGNIVYDWLIRTGKIEVGYGHKFVREAKEILLKENKKKLISELNTSIRQQVTKVLREVEGNQSNLIVVLAKKIAVNHYFTQTK